MLSDSRFTWTVLASLYAHLFFHGFLPFPTLFIFLSSPNSHWWGFIAWGLPREGGEAVSFAFFFLYFEWRCSRIWGFLFSFGVFKKVISMLSGNLDGARSKLVIWQPSSLVHFSSQQNSHIYIEYIDKSGNKVGRGRKNKKIHPFVQEWDTS